MKKTLKLIGTIVLAVAIVFTMAACGGGGGGGCNPLSNTSYKWTDGGNSYDLIISETGAKANIRSGNFLLLITASGNTTPYTGTATSSGDDITLKSGGDTVELTLSGNDLTVKSGTIGSKTILPGTVTPTDGSTGSGNPFIGTWKCDDKANMNITTWTSPDLSDIRLSSNVRR
jgi:hypothetical protein